MSANKIYLIPILFISLLYFTGCYTQLATKDFGYSHEEDNYGYYDNQEFEDSTESGDEYTQDYNYDENDNITINKYYFGGYPFYRRYFWSYHPSFYFGISFGDWYYDPYYWDPFYYWNWCGTWWYYPSYYYSYYYPYHYYNYYGWYGYNHGFYKYRDRNRDNYSIRNNNGLRNSYVTRGGLTGRTDGTLTKNLENRERSRDILLNKNNDTRNRDLLKDKNSLTRTEKNRETTRSNTSERNKKESSSIKKNSTDRQKYIRERESIKYTPPKVKKETNTNTKPKSETKRNNEVRTERRTNQTPKSYSPPQRTYSPPSSNTPRNTTPPRSSSSGGSNRGSERRR